MEVAELTLEQATALEDECRNERHTLHRDAIALISIIEKLLSNLKRAVFSFA